jgi:hypothetical protein
MLCEGFKFSSLKWIEQCRREAFAKYCSARKLGAVRRESSAFVCLIVFAISRHSTNLPSAAHKISRQQLNFVLAYERPPQSTPRTQFLPPLSEHGHY